MNKKICSLFLIFLLLISTVSVSAYVPIADHFPDGYRYYMVFGEQGIPRAYYFKNLYNFFYDGTYLYCYPSEPIAYTSSWTISDADMENHMCVNPWHYTNGDTIPQAYTSTLKIGAGRLFMSNFTVKTTNSSGQTFTFLRTDESLTENYEVVTNGDYDGTNGDAVLPDENDGILSGISSLISNIIDVLGDLLSKILDAIIVVKDFVVSFFEKVIDLVVSLVIPSDGFMESKYQEFLSNFAFVNRLNDFAHKMYIDFQYLYTEHAPSINIDLSKSKSKIIRSDKVVNFINLDWFAEYKVYSDVLISTFLWAWFLWRTYCRIPDILNGLGMIASDNIYIHDGYNGKRRGR